MVASNFSKTSSVNSAVNGYLPLFRVWKVKTVRKRSASGSWLSNSHFPYSAIDDKNGFTLPMAMGVFEKIFLVQRLYLCASDFLEAMNINCNAKCNAESHSPFSQFAPSHHRCSNVALLILIQQ